MTKTTNALKEIEDMKKKLTDPTALAGDLLNHGSNYLGFRRLVEENEGVLN